MRGPMGFSCVSSARQVRVSNLLYHVVIFARVSPLSLIGSHLSGALIGADLVDPARPIAGLVSFPYQLLASPSNLVQFFVIRLI